jgi:hypothetical protein
MKRLVLLSAGLAVVGSAIVLCAHKGLAQNYPAPGPAQGDFGRLGCN